MTCFNSAAEMCPSLFLSKTYASASGSSQFGYLKTHFESLPDLLLGIGIVHLPCHERHELSEINRVVAIRVDLGRISSCYCA